MFRISGVILGRGKEVFANRTIPEKEESVLSENDWRDLVSRKLKEAEENNLPKRFFASKDIKRDHPEPDGYYFDFEGQTDGNELVVIFITRQGVKIGSNLLDSNKNILQEAIILKKNKKPRYVYVEAIETPKAWRLEWKMTIGKDNVKALQLAFSAMQQKSVLFGLNEKSPTNWRGRSTDLSGIKELLSREKA